MKPTSNIIIVAKESTSTLIACCCVAQYDKTDPDLVTQNKVTYVSSFLSTWLRCD
jgi:hypothetical protein